jgi:precorrin-8X/cobalt-precorrin-8 methylmutase
LSLLVPPLHPITAESFAIIDREFGPHALDPAEYAIIRRVIHTTADFDYRDRLSFSPGAIAAAVAALIQRRPIVVDVTMVEQGIRGLLNETFGNPIVSAIRQAPALDRSSLGETLGQILDPISAAAPGQGQTRTARGMAACVEQWPQAIYVIGNAPTALLMLADQVRLGKAQPAVVIAAPVGFVSVVESKAAIAALPPPQIRVEGRKGGSPVAAAILNALIMLACAAEDQS